MCFTQERWEEISSLIKSSQTSGILHYLLQPGVVHTPLDIAEVTFDLLEVYKEKRWQRLASSLRLLLICKKLCALIEINDSAEFISFDTK